MRLSHTELETCLTDPVAWLAKSRTPAGPRTLGYDQILKLGILRFHRQGGASPLDARKHIEAIFGRQPKLRSASRKDDVFRRFDDYVEWCKGATPIVGGIRTRVRLEISAELTLSGEVPRVDVVESGYRGILLGKHAEQWKEEVRMPLLQLALANVLARPVEEVAIGVQHLDGSGLESRRFSAAAIARAKRELRQLARRLADEVASSAR